jgi:HlyD family secretion protein
MSMPLSPRHSSTFRLLFRIASPVFLLLVTSCGTGDSVERGPERLLPSVEAVETRHGTLPLSERLSGLVKAKNQVEIYPQITAVITGVPVENGDAVGKDEPLVYLRDTEFRERLKQAKANHQIALAQLRRAQALAKEAQAEIDRLRALAQEELASEAELEASEARTESARAEVELAQARVEQALAGVDEQQENLAQTVIRAPITGRAGNRDAEVGMLASPSSRLFTLGQLDSVRVEIILTDRMLHYIEEGQRTEVSVAGLTESAPLSRISPFLHPVSHSTRAEIDMANSNGLLKPGMFVTVDVFYGESEEATLVPLSALYENRATGMVGVYVTRASLEPEPVDEMGMPETSSLTDPVAFEFVPAQVVAQGHMEAAIRGVETGVWVVALGQNLLGGEKAEARVRAVPWDRVERLQRLQREDLMQDLIERRTTR